MIPGLSNCKYALAEYDGQWRCCSFLFWFLGMVIIKHANEVETKEKGKLPEIKN